MLFAAGLDGGNTKVNRVTSLAWQPQPGLAFSGEKKHSETDGNG